MSRLDRWELLDFDPGKGLEANAATDAAGDWISVVAPGDTYVSLIGAGRLQHPFQGRAEEAAAWVRDREWWWRTTFDAPSIGVDETAELVFEGLDTFASIYLDGILVGRTDNMFRRYAFDIRQQLQTGARHTLAICFDPPALAAVDMPLPVWSAFTDRVSRSKRNLMRKAQFGWGWDWGPDL
ncbi:MAG: glycoside hydrolase family 2 protein, partial [Caulobacteraceae bacterium]